MLNAKVFLVWWIERKSMNKLENNLTFGEMHALKLVPRLSVSTAVVGDILWLVLVSTTKAESFLKQLNYSASKYELYSAMLSTMLYIAPSDLIYLINECLYPFTNISLFLLPLPSPPGCWQPLFYSLFL